LAPLGLRERERDRRQGGGGICRLERRDGCQVLTGGVRRGADPERLLGALAVGLARGGGRLRLRHGRRQAEGERPEPDQPAAHNASSPAASTCRLPRAAATTSVAPSPLTSAATRPVQPSSG